MIKRAVALLLFVTALTWAGPAALSAHADDSYVAPARVSVHPAVIEPGGRSTIEFSTHFFEPSESVSTEIAGEKASRARVATPEGATALVSRADGGMTAVFTAPARGSGPYAITFTASRTDIVIVTVVPPDRTQHAPEALAPPGPDLGAGWGIAVPGPDAGLQPPSGGHAWPNPPDREGRVQIPAGPPEAPDWPRLEEVPWSILLLAAIALVVTTVTGTLLVAARRRG